MIAQDEFPICVAAFYQFVHLEQPDELRVRLQDLCTALDLRGTLLVAKEGVNGTVSGTGNAVAALLDHLRRVPGLGDMEAKLSRAKDLPFHRMKVRLKREIVTMGIGEIDARNGVGTYVEPSDWNELIARPDVLVIDARNDYEIAIGSFEGAIDPQTGSFTELPSFLDGQSQQMQSRPVAMFCTGGIRCEKATAYLRARGFDEVYHLQGGILRYLEEVPEEESLWRGECFVFDERVSVTHGVKQGEAALCRACRRPLTPKERQSAHFVEGVSCHYCRGERSDADRRRYGERHRQVKLAGQRGGKRHIGR